LGGGFNSSETLTFDATLSVKPSSGGPQHLGGRHFRTGGKKSGLRKCVNDALTNEVALASYEERAEVLKDESLKQCS